jgi:hypothetical protein
MALARYVVCRWCGQGSPLGIGSAAFLFDMFEQLFSKRSKADLLRLCLQA